MSLDQRKVLVFVSADPEDKPLVDKLEKHLATLSRQGVIELRHRGKVPVAANMRAWVDEQLDAAEMVVLMLSPDFIGSEDVYQDLERAMRLRDEKRTCVVPVLARTVELKGTPVDALVKLPRSGKPIGSTTNDATYAEIVSELGAMITDLRQRPKPAPTAKSPASPAGQGLLDMSPPFPWHHPAASQLLSLLIQAYDDVHAARYVCAQVQGLDTGRVPMTLGMEPLWRGVLEAAANQGKLRGLLEVVLRDPGVAAFHAPIRAAVAAPRTSPSSP